MKPSEMFTLSKYQKDLLEMAKSGKRFAVVGGRRNNWIRQLEADQWLHGIISKMKVGQTIAICGLDGIRVLRMEEINPYKNGAEISFKSYEQSKESEGKK